MRTSHITAVFAAILFCMGAQHAIAAETDGTTSITFWPPQNVAECTDGMVLAYRPDHPTAPGTYCVAPGPAPSGSWCGAYYTIEGCAFASHKVLPAVIDGSTACGDTYTVFVKKKDIHRYEDDNHLLGIVHRDGTSYSEKHAIFKGLCGDSDDDYTLLMCKPGYKVAVLDFSGGTAASYSYIRTCIKE